MFGWLTVAVPASVYYHTVALAVDRVVAILAPIRHRNLNKLTTARRMSLVNTLGAFTLTTVEFPFRVMDTQRNKCAYSMNPLPVYFSVYLTSILFLFPLLTLLISNAVFVRALKKRSTGRATTPSMDPAANAREAQRRSNERNYIRMMVVTTCAFILLRILTIGLFNEAARRSRLRLQDGSPQFVRTVARFPTIFISSLNVVFYSSSPMFRTALKQSLKKLK